MNLRTSSGPEMGVTFVMQVDEVVCPDCISAGTCLVKSELHNLLVGGGGGGGGVLEVPIKT